MTTDTPPIPAPDPVPEPTMADMIERAEANIAERLAAKQTAAAQAEPLSLPWWNGLSGVLVGSRS
jgi:hypothetical protein